MHVIHDSALGLEIANRVVQTYLSNQCPSSGRPTVRSNGVEEWTILAGVVAIYPDASMEVLSMATGSKTIPDAMRPYSKGKMVHDLHSEVLALRGLNHLLLHEAVGLGQPPTDTTAGCERSALPTTLKEPARVLEVNPMGSRPFRVKPGLKLALFITEPPCGDASMEYLRHQRTAEAGSQRKRTWEDRSHPGLEDQPALFTRGREGFDNLGSVRTKPGRADSPLSLSKSCLDKLALKQTTSVLNAITNQFVAETGAFLSYLVLPEGKFVESDLTRCFGRGGVPPVPMTLLAYKDPGTYPHGKPTTEGPTVYAPAPCSLMVIPHASVAEVLNAGVRQGRNLNSVKTARLFAKTGCGVIRGGESAVSTFRMCETAIKSGLITATGSYKEWKATHPKREEAKKGARAALGEWVEAQIDDFELPQPVLGV